MTSCLQVQLVFVCHSLLGGVDVLSLGLEEAQHLFALRDVGGEPDQRLQEETEGQSQGRSGGGGLPSRIIGSEPNRVVLF